jgi:hypothetical protein
MASSRRHLPERSTRVGDRERRRAVDLLQRHAGRGSLSVEELETRADQALAATTRHELESVLRDLPDLGRGEPVRRTRAVLGSVARRGAWRVPDRTHATALLGTARLDLTRAVPEGEEIDVCARAVLGGVEVIVPEGTDVEFTGRGFLGLRRERIKDRPARPGSPLVRVRALAVLGTVRVKSRRVEPRSRILSELVSAFDPRRLPR